MAKIDKKKPFLLKLWMMLEEEDVALIRWDEPGSAFIIPDLKKVEDQILPKYFRAKHFSSFQRQMNYFGFHKRKLANGHCSFYHCNFHRDFPEQLILIKRKGIDDKPGLEPCQPGPAACGAHSAIASGMEDRRGGKMGGDLAEALGFSMVGVDEVGCAGGGRHGGENTRRAVTNGEYTGQWQGGKRHGTGVMTWDDGDKYEGDFVHDKRHGQGKYTYASGNIYEGTWSEDMKHGHGTYLWTSGSKYTGDYKSDKKHGIGLMVRSNGNRQEGRFERDLFMGTADVKAPSPPSSPRADASKRRRVSFAPPLKSEQETDPNSEEGQGWGDGEDEPPSKRRAADAGLPRASEWASVCSLLATKV
jgi:hypothetical protein